MKKWKVWFTHTIPYVGYTEDWLIAKGNTVEEVYKKFHRNHDENYEIQSVEPLD